MKASTPTIPAEGTQSMLCGVSASAQPDFKGGVVFFDLAGTLVDPDAQLSESRKRVLRRFGTESSRVVLVTGQSSDDPQVEEVCRLFITETPVQFVAYVTRGGVRLVRRGTTLVRDDDYFATNRLEEEQQSALRRAIGEVLVETGLQTIIPVKCVDGVAMRVNLRPADRPEFVAAMQANLLEESLRGFQVVSEGRTSVFVTRSGMGKRQAVLFELQEFLKQTPAGKAYFFGNEFYEGGNDQEVLNIPNLRVMALGDVVVGRSAAIVHVLGRSPDELYAFLESHRDGTGLRQRNLPVLFISLGGTKFKIGALTRSAVYVSEAEIHWRGTHEFAACFDDEQPSGFCDALARWAENFLNRHGYEWHDVGIVGISLPGPFQEGRWQSFNLTKSFQKGVVLDQAFDRAVKLLAGDRSPECTRVVFDAQCDAGGELYHPVGRLSRAASSAGQEGAVVLNMATGIAAGFIREGKVLIAEEDFARLVGRTYDGGAGQVGRHLWRDIQTGTWTYHYVPRGGVPEVENAVRLTEYLSGPALAARLLLRLGEHGNLPQPYEWANQCVPHSRITSIYEDLVRTKDMARRTQCLRQGGSPLATAVLSWADGIYRFGQPAGAASCIRLFASEVADELASALKAWAAAPGWEPFMRHVVLSGGVGIHFLASADTIPELSFLAMLRNVLPAGMILERSLLFDSAERGVYLFWHQLQECRGNR